MSSTVEEPKSGDSGSSAVPETDGHIANARALRKSRAPLPGADDNPLCEFCGTKRRLTLHPYPRYMKCTRCTLRPLSPVSITRLRTLMCMTQEEFARQLNVTRLCVWQWENGLRVPHDRHRRALLRLAKGNHVPVEFYEKSVKNPEGAGIAKEPTDAGI